MELTDDNYCFACGRENPWGLRLSFKKEGEGRVSAMFVSKREHQGYKGIVHGGILSAVLDEAMAHAAISMGLMPVTAELTVRFKTPLFVGEEAIVEAEIKQKDGRLIDASSVIRRASDKKTIAVGRSKLMGEAG
jgi:uncharacterized protein (TIGR00369 family)